ncbi:MAG: bifunctional folylpolyglutamate synthase/dihydrofolate synthase [Alphaproteobacteria bacterium]|nr:bifunctional folylpolyglutamate synthase/dihydrofolate synthase [Alphaproteobacteria bacterium]
MNPADPVAHFLNTTFGDEFAPASAFDLQPLRDALDCLGAPHRRLPPTIHVAGTNGKGSTCAFLAALAAESGLSAHAFTKPHLLRTAERVRLVGGDVSDDAFLDALARVAAIAPALRHFEAQVAAAFLLFSEAPADLVILETGFGGRDDATNVIERPVVTIITPIDLDHAAILGATIPEIAAHKAGIIKRSTPVVVARQADAAAAIIAARAEVCTAPLLRFGQEWDAYAKNGRLVVQTEARLFDLDLPALAGPHQVENAGAAIVAFDQVTRLSDDDASAAMRSAFIPARLQRIRGDREIWIDGAHNPHAARAIALALSRMPPRKTTIILGMLARKDADAYLAELVGAADHVITSPIAGCASIAAQDLAQTAKRRGLSAAASESLADALAQAAPDSRILITGSLAFAAEALTRTERLR